MSYVSDFQTKLTEQPVKHRLRILEFRFQQMKHRFKLQQLSRRIGEAQKRSIVKVPFCLQPSPYHYCGHQGPWIEDFFYEYWISHQIQSHITYLPIFFDSFFLHGQVHKYTPKEFEYISRQLRTILQEVIQPNRLYFTILGMYDFPIWDWHLFPKNVLVFSANGGGDIPIPLLNGEPNFSCPPKEILISFMGNLGGSSNRGGVRQSMYESLKDFAYFGQGPNWRSVMQQSIFTLCPRGLGRASFRLYEALSVGSIPIYIWDDVKWLPYQDVLDWSEISISINVKDCDRIPDLVQSHSNAEIRCKQERIAELYPRFFTLEAVCQNILRMLKDYQSLTDIYQLTNQRSFD